MVMSFLLLMVQAKTLVTLCNRPHDSALTNVVVSMN